MRHGRRIDAMIVDIDLAGSSGLDLVRQVRELNLEPPVVYVSGHPVAIHQALEAGALVLPKPVSRSRLQRILDEALPQEGSNS